MGTFWDIPFIVVDVETTGSDSKRNRITDIACVTVLGGEIISEFSSLVNPHQSIPPFISRMTGITYDMVFNAPEAKEIFVEVSELFKNKKAVFTAHNVKFDLGFVNRTLQRTKFDKLTNPYLCTLKLARRLLPVKQKKNVDALSDYFNIPVTNRHRALGDASATAKFLIQLLETAESEHGITTIEELLKFQNKQLRHFQAPSATLKRVEKQLKELPDAPGVYNFIDKYNEILYIGKAKSLKSRVKSYFQIDTFTSKKIARMFRMIHKIRWECTNTELEALLLESKEIKKHKPHYNTVDKKYKSYPFVKLTIQNDFPIFETCNSIEPDGAEYYGPLRSAALAEDLIRNVESKFKIRKCKDKPKPSAKKKPCFYYHIEQCLSPCSTAVSKKDYSKEINKIRLYLTGLPEGIITQLENKMNYFAGSLEFEKAEQIKRNILELKKLFSKNESVPTSINKNNLIIIIPLSEKEKTLNLYMIKSGMLHFQKTIGRKSKLDEIFNVIHEIYYNGQLPVNVFSKEDIDEIRIVSNWINKQNGGGEFLYLEEKQENVFYTELENSIRNIRFPESDQNEYSE